MDPDRRKKVVLRWTLFITALVAAYRLWRWHALGALVPVTAWHIDVRELHALGFEVSPLWDILVAAAITAFAAFFWTSPRLHDSQDPDKETMRQKATFLLLMIPVAGVVLGLFFSLLNGLTVGIAMGFVFSAAEVVLFFCPLLALYEFLRWLAACAPLRAFGRWLMGR